MPKTPKAPRKWWILLAMTAAVSMIFIDITVLPVALPTIQRKLGIPSLGLQWIVNAYTLSLTIFLLAGGWLGARFGSRRIFICGLFLFALSSALCGLSNSAAELILFRAIQGMGGALLIPSAAPIIFATFSPKERGKAMGLYVGIGSVFFALGPFIGGVFAQYLSWHYIFWINLPISLIGLILTLIFVPEMEKQKRAFDWKGFLTFSAGVSAIVIALMQAKNWGWTSPITLLLFCLGAAFLILLLFIEKKAKDPYVDFSLYKNRNFLGASLAVACFQFLAMVTVYWSIFFQNVSGFSPAQAGAIILISNAPLIILSPIGGHLYDKHGPRPPVTVGFLLISVGLFLLLLNIDTKNLLILLMAVIPYGCGRTFVLIPSFTFAVSEVPPEKRAITVGSIATLRQLGGTLGLAIITSVFLTVQEGQFAEDLQRNTSTLSLAPKTFTGLLSKAPKAIVALEALPEETRTYVKQSRVHSFISGFRAINILSLIAALLGLGMFLWLVKKRTQPKL
ncbi:MAG: Multidrug resistance protein Stp [Chlamydiae bacterium]|nr:Multidrug resistance protein Stp [Chlamydiota bacterium]